MERSQFVPLTPSSEGPNPYRPYYKPPSIGLSHDSPPSQAPGQGFGAGNQSNSNSFGSSARNMLGDIDYNEILGDAGATGGASLKGILDQLFWRYTSVFMAQPFEVAKTILQVRMPSVAPPPGQHRSDSRTASFKSHDYISDDDDDEPSYFTSSTPHSAAALPRRVPSRQYSSSPSRSLAASPSPASPRPKQPQSAQPSYKLELRKNDSLTEVISQLWAREGSWGVWKATHVSFLYGLLQRTIEAWTRGMLATVLNLPDPGLSAMGAGVGGLDIIDSPSPLASLTISIAAAAVAGLVLAPLDIVRTRLIVTPTVSATRSILPCLKALGSWTCPPALIGPTLLHSILPTLFSTTSPLVLRNYLRIDPILTPATYSVCTFLSSTVELFARLPIETVLRRGQVNLVVTQERLREASEQSRHGGRSSKRRAAAAADDIDDERSETLSSSTSTLRKIDTVVEIGPYTGVIATMWRIAQEEGETVGQVRASEAVYATTKPKRGQGVYGLWRGWRVGWWGLVGVWGAAALGGAGGKGGEF